MPRPTKFVACLIAVVGLTASNQSRAEESDLKRMEGTWIGVVVGEEEEGKVTMTIERDRVEFQGSNPQEWYKGEIELGGDDEKLKKLYATIKECPIKELIDKVCKGIYKLDDDTLTISATAPGSDDGPKGFDDRNCRTIQLKRRP